MTEYSHSIYSPSIYSLSGELFFDLILLVSVSIYALRLLYLMGAKNSNPTHINRRSRPTASIVNGLTGGLIAGRNRL